MSTTKFRKSAGGPKDPTPVLPQKFIIDKRLQEVEDLKYRDSEYHAKIKALQKEVRSVSSTVWLPVLRFGSGVSNNAVLAWRSCFITVASRFLKRATAIP